MKSRSREIKSLAQGHPAGKGPDWDLNSCLSDFNACIPLIVQQKNKNRSIPGQVDSSQDNNHYDY